MKQYLNEIKAILGPDQTKIPRLTVAFLLVSGLDFLGIGLVGPYVALVLDPEILDGPTGEFVDALGLERDKAQLTMLVGISLLGVFALKTFAGVACHRLIIQFSQQQQVRLRSFLMNTFQNLPYTEYLRRNSSEYIHSISTLTVQYSNYVLLPLLQVVADGMAAAMILILLAIINGPILLVLTVLLAIALFGYDRVFRRPLVEAGKEYNDALTSLLQGVDEGIGGLKEIRVLGYAGFFHDKVKAGAQRAAIYNGQQQLVSIIPRYLLELVLIVFGVSALMYSLQAGHDLTKSLPTLAVFGAAAVRLLPIASQVARTIIALRYSRDSVLRLYEDLILANKAEASKGLTDNRRPHEKEHERAPFEHLSLNGISFRYPSAERNSLDQITLTLSSGECIGFIGSSGAGKTTLVDVLLGLLHPQTGTIEYNSTPLLDKLDRWHSHVAYLPQEVFLMDNSLRRNVALGLEDDQIDEAQVLQALKQARLETLVNELPEGLDTELGEHGVRLSGGQRQRVSLARALYHRRSVLIMDEATSALDNKTESEIAEEIRQLKGQVTLVIIAHRLTTVEQCDRIYRLENGKIIDSGKPEQLLRMHPSPA